MDKMNNRIELSTKERRRFKEFVSKGKQPCRIVQRVKIILALDHASGKKTKTKAQIAELFGISRQSIYVIQQDYLQKPIEEFLQRKRREAPPVSAKVDGKFEARLIALCCSPPPKGYARWNLRLLADTCIELGYIDSVSHMTVSRTLKKTNLNRI
jgi:hypothetical protein